MVNEQITLRKFNKQSEEIGALRFFEMKEIFPFVGHYDMEDPDFVHIEIPKVNFDTTIEKGHIFKGPDRYLWLKKEVEIPKGEEGFVPYGYFDFGRGGCNEGFEALLYVNGQPCQGIDENHREVNFSDYSGQKVELIFMLWSGLDARGEFEFFEHKIARAEVGYLHEDSDQLYYYTMGIAQSLEYLDRNLTEYEQLKLVAEKTFKQINWSKDAFYSTATTALNVMKAELEKTPKNSNVTVHCVGHTHIDVAWLWRLKHTREKEIRSFTTALRQMDNFEEYRFIQSQPHLYKYIKADRPDIYAEIKKRIEQGAWEPEGGMWVEADCNISSGEALSRQLLYGTRFFELEFGKKSEFLWLPDVFGYSWALPQILKLCDIKTFMTTKISWNQYNTIPNDLFTWRGIDGSEILTYFIDTPNDEGDLDVRYATYNGMLNPRAVIGSWKRFKNKELSNEVLIAFGYGDGGGGPTLQMQKLRRVMDELPGLPNVKQTTAGDFFNIIHKNVEKAETSLNVWDGELYLEYHRGTYTSQAKTKKWNRKLENELVKTEWLATLAGGDYPKTIIEDAWEVLMLNQFHDIIPGSSIADVYKDADKQYKEAYSKLLAVQEEVLNELVSTQDNSYTIFGFNGFKRQNFVTIHESREGYFTQKGKVIPAQRNEQGYDVSVEIDGLELAAVEFITAETETVREEFKLEAGALTTPYYTIEFDSNGFISGIFDKEFGKQIVKHGGLMNALEVYEDKPLNYENWDIDYYYTQKREYFSLVAAPEIVENGALYVVIKTEYQYGNSKMVQHMKVYSGNRRIDFTTIIDWQEDYKLLKAAFDINLRNNKASFDIQYGYVERPTHSNTSWDVARFEVVAHKWADISENNYGVSILNDCKYGYSVKDSTMSLTLLKSTKDPDPDADRGEHEFVYSILPHEGRVADGETIAQAHMLNYPETAVIGSTNRQTPLFSINSDNIVIDAVKPAENGIGTIIRMHEAKGGSDNIKLTTTLPEATIEECNILERVLFDKQNIKDCSISFTPFEIKTFRII